MGMVGHFVLPALKMPRQEDYEFRVNIDYMVRLCFWGQGVMLR